MTTTAPCSSFCETAHSTPVPMVSAVWPRQKRRSSGINMASLWADRCGFPNSLMGRTGSFSCPTSKASACITRDRTSIAWLRPRCGPEVSQIIGANVIRDPLTSQPFPNNVIPTARLDPIAQKLLEFFPTPNLPEPAWRTTTWPLDNNVTNKDQFTQRIDFVESSRSNWFGRLQLGRRGQ